MKIKSNILLGLYDLILAFGAAETGLLMLKADYGIFKEVPTELMGILPFNSWFLPGLAVMMLFGLGNLVAAVLSFTGKRNRTWFASALSGGLLLVLVIVQVIVLKQWYLASVEILLASLVQLLLSGYTLCCRSVK